MPFTVRHLGTVCVAVVAACSASVSISRLAAQSVTVPAGGIGTEVTFTKDVAPIFYKSCIDCHRANMFAPMSLTSYEDARPWLSSIKRRVMERTMPPWGSDMPHGVFQNDPRLTEQEIQTVVSWIDGGASKGDTGDNSEASCDERAPV